MELRNVPAYPICFLLLVSLAVMAIAMRRRPVWPLSVLLASAANLFTLFPALVLMAMMRAGAAGTVQFNVGSSEAMRWWSTWAGLFPVFFFGLLACCAVALGTALTFIVSRLRRSGRDYDASTMAFLLLTIAHCGFTAFWVMQNFPSA
jgi:hypothetical protein